MGAAANLIVKLSLRLSRRRCAVPSAAHPGALCASALVWPERPRVAKCDRVNPIASSFGITALELPGVAQVQDTDVKHISAPTVY